MHMRSRNGQLVDLRPIHFLYAYPLMCAVGYLVLLVGDNRDAPREIATLLALYGDTGIAVPVLEPTRPVIVKGSVAGYIVTYTFRSTDGGQHAVTQRVHPDQWPLKPPLVVTYARRWPGLATLDVAVSGRRVWEAAVIPPLFAGIIMCCGLLCSGIIWGSRAIGTWRCRRRQARKKN